MLMPRLNQVASCVRLFFGVLLFLVSITAFSAVESFKSFEREIDAALHVNIAADSEHRGVAGFRDFFYPMYHGSRLSYCTADKKICGLDLATKYCKLLGYDRASRVEVDHNVGLTRYPDPGKSLQCQGYECDGFKWLTCVESLKKKTAPIYYYRYRDFEAPRFENYRVAWCYSEGKSCGARAANAFCRQQGYQRARGYEKDTKVAATRMIGDGKLCFGGSCQGFERITCYR